MRSRGAIAAEIEFDVAFHDVDMVGVVWHGHYLRYFENARWALMDRLGYGLMYTAKAEGRNRVYT